MHVFKLLQYSALSRKPPQAVKFAYSIMDRGVWFGALERSIIASYYRCGEPLLTVSS